ncbi:unnamed protein product, partial [Allacma fusca]
VTESAIVEDQRRYLNNKLTALEIALEVIHE